MFGRKYTWRLEPGIRLNLFPVLFIFILNDDTDRDEFTILHSNIKSRDSAVGTATGYGLNDRGVGVRVPV
jgi:hypothetical protein